MGHLNRLLRSHSYIPAKGDPIFLASLVNTTGQVNVGQDRELYVVAGSGNSRGAGNGALAHVAHRHT